MRISALSFAGMLRVGLSGQITQLTAVAFNRMAQRKQKQDRAERNINVAWLRGGGERGC